MTHYVANLKVQKVTDSAGPNRGPVTEVAQVTVKADTLPKLIEKVGKHVQIIEED